MRVAEGLSRVVEIGLGQSFCAPEYDGAGERLGSQYHAAALGQACHAQVREGRRLGVAARGYHEALACERCHLLDAREGLTAATTGGGGSGGGGGGRGGGLR